ncbi:MAG: MFS family permease [Planctomycetota bacterium]|jgi:MFS family permease
MSTTSVNPARLRRNVSVIRLLNFTWMFILLMPVIVPFFGELGLSQGEVFRVQAIFSLSIVVLEVPLGYVSDMVGRRGCLILAGLLHGVAFTLLTFVSGFWGVALFEVVAAVGVCLFSGTDVALLYDSLEALDDHEGRRKALGLRLFWMQTGETLAALVGGWIALVGLAQVALWNAVVGWLPFFAALLLVEVPIARMSQGSHRENFALIRRELFSQSRTVRLVMLNLVAYGLSTLLAVWAFQGFWGHMQIDLLWFGYLWAGYNLTVALVGRLAHSIEVRMGPMLTLGLIATLPVIGYAGMGLLAWNADAQPSFGAAALGVALGLTFQVGRGFTQVVLKAELNHRVAPEMRATANSVSSLGVRMGYVLLGPALGLLIDGPGYGAAFGAASGVFLLVALLLALPLALDLRRVRAASIKP